MNDTLTIGDENLISSKRASELSGYAQDYIGQLARKGLIEGKRVGGLWYVSLDSLNAYKTNADSYIPRPPQASNPSTESDSIISFDGHDYVSAARAARLTGYHPDYVGQLARTGKILSRQVGNRWYVDRDAILAHKSEKDALLGAVQAQSVGVAVPKKNQDDVNYATEPFFKYRTEGRDLIPKPHSERMNYQGMYEEYDEIRHPISIRRQVEVEQDEEAGPIISRNNAHKAQKPRNKRRNRGALVILSLIGLMIVVFSAFYLLKSSAPASAHTRAGSTEAPTSLVQTIKNAFQNLFAKELIYTKPE